MPNARKPIQEADPELARLIKLTQKENYSLLFCGGSFNPPHKTHIDLAVAAGKKYLEQLKEKNKDAKLSIVFMPAKQNPLKTQTPLPATKRTEQLKQLIQAELNLQDESITIHVSTYETNQPDDTSLATAESVKAYHNAGCQNFSFVFGEDILKTFHHWEEPGSFVELVEGPIYIAPRIENTEAFIRLSEHEKEKRIHLEIDKLKEKFESILKTSNNNEETAQLKNLLDNLEKFVPLLHFNMSIISSTNLRDKLT